MNKDVGLKDTPNKLFISRVILISPSDPGTPQNARILRGAPFGLSSPRDVTARVRLRGGVNFAAHLSHGCSFPPSEYTFGGDPLESIVL